MPDRHVDMEEYEDIEVQSEAPKSVPAWLFVVTTSAGILFITGLALLAYSYGSNTFERVQELETEVEEASEVAQEEASAMSVPLFYAIYNRGNHESELRTVDRLTGEETIVFMKDDVFDLFAVPQIGYDGRVILQEYPQERPGEIVLTVVNVETGDWSPADRKIELPTSPAAIVLAPDQVHAVAVYDTGYDGGEAPKDIVMWNLLDGSRNFLGSIGELEYFERDGQFDIAWMNQSCVEIGVFGDIAQEDGSLSRQIIEYRLFCE